MSWDVPCRVATLLQKTHQKEIKQRNPGEIPASPSWRVEKFGGAHLEEELLLFLTLEAAFPPPEQCWLSPETLNPPSVLPPGQR